MLTRILSGIVALSLVFPVLIYGGVVGAKLLVGAVLLVVLKEFSPIASPEHPTGAWLLTTGVGAAVYAQVSFGTDPAVTVAAMVVAVGLLLSWAMFVHEDPEEGALSGAVTALVASESHSDALSNGEVASMLTLDSRRGATQSMRHRGNTT